MQLKMCQCCVFQNGAGGPGGGGGISNNGLLVRAITDILFYIDLIGTMVEIN